MGLVRQDVPGTVAVPTMPPVMLKHTYHFGESRTLIVDELGVRNAPPSCPVPWARVSAPLTLRRMSDEQLLMRSAAGDSAAFDELYQRQLPYVRNLVRKMLRTDEHLEDVVQEVMLRLYRSAAHFDPARPLRKWLITITVNEVRRYLSRQRTVISLSTKIGSGSEQLELTSVLKDGHAGPQEEADQQQMARQIVRLLDRLPAVQRETVRLRHLNDLSLTEISELMGCPVATVASRLHYAIARLRGWLQGTEVAKVRSH